MGGNKITYICVSTNKWFLVAMRKVVREKCGRPLKIHLILEPYDHYLLRNNHIHLHEWEKLWILKKNFTCAHKTQTVIGKLQLSNDQAKWSDCSGRWGRCLILQLSELSAIPWTQMVMIMVKSGEVIEEPCKECFLLTKWCIFFYCVPISDTGPQFPGTLGR